MDDLSSSADQSQPPHACSQENGKILTKQLFDLLTTSMTNVSQRSTWSKIVFLARSF